MVSNRSSASYDAERMLRRLFKRCVECPGTQPSCPPCGGDQICSLVPQDCNSCAHMTCISNPSPAPSSHGPNVGAIAGGVVGGVAFIAVIVFLVWRFSIRQRRAQQDAELEEEWEDTEVTHQKRVHRFSATAADTASTRTRGSLANSILSRASNIIQIAYIPGVTNRNGSGRDSLLAAHPVPPIPAALRGGPQTPKSPLAGQGDALFFRPGDLRDSTYSTASSMRSAGNRDTRYTMQSITPSLARSSMASDVYFDDATSQPMPATAVTRVAPRMVSVKSGSSPGESPVAASSPRSMAAPNTNTNTTQQTNKGLQVLVPGQGGTLSSSSRSSSQNAGSQFGRPTQITLGGKNKGRFPVRQASDSSLPSSAMHTPASTSPLAPTRDEYSDVDEDEHARARQSLMENIDFSTPPPIQPAESPFFDASESLADPSATRPNPYASMASTVGSKTEGDSSRGGPGGTKSVGGLSAVIEEATRRASRVPSHTGLGGRMDADGPFSDEHATD